MDGGWGRWVRERHGFDSVPLLVRPGAVIAEGAVEDRPDYDHADDVTLRVYELPDGARVTTRVAAAAFTTTRDGAVLRAEAAAEPGRDAPGAWNLLLVNADPAALTVEGGTVAEHDQGVLVHATGHEIVVTGVTAPGGAPTGTEGEPR